jgi:hypothetical protein
MSLYVFNYDQPESFPPSKVAITRHGMQVGSRGAVGVELDPPIPGLSSGPLLEAVLVSRREVEISAFLATDPRPGLAVYVCRYPAGGIDSAPEHLERDDLRIEFWGLLSDSPSCDIRER